MAEQTAAERVRVEMDALLKQQEHSRATAGVRPWDEGAYRISTHSEGVIALRLTAVLPALLADHEALAARVAHARDWATFYAGQAAYFAAATIGLEDAMKPRADPPMQRVADDGWDGGERGNG